MIYVRPIPNTTNSKNTVGTGSIAAPRTFRLPTADSCLLCQITGGQGQDKLLANQSIEKIDVCQGF